MSKVSEALELQAKVDGATKDLDQAKVIQDEIHRLQEARQMYLNRAKQTLNDVKELRKNDERLHAVYSKD